MQRTINTQHTKTTQKLDVVFRCLSVAIVTIFGGLFFAYYFNNLSGVHAEGNTVDFSIQSTDSISVSLPSDPLVLALKTNAGGQFGRAALDIDVSTNSATGYSLTMLSSSDRLTRSAQVNGTDYYINTLESSITCTDEADDTCTEFTVNRWGYRVSAETSYLPITPATVEAQVINTTNGPANSSITTVYFGAKLNNTIPVGSYDGVTLTFAATINPETLAASIDGTPAEESSVEEAIAEEAPANEIETEEAESETETETESENSIAPVATSEE